MEYKYILISSTGNQQKVGIVDDEKLYIAAERVYKYAYLNVHTS